MQQSHPTLNHRNSLAVSYLLGGKPLAGPCPAAQSSLQETALTRPALPQLLPYTAARVRLSAAAAASAVQEGCCWAG